MNQCLLPPQHQSTTIWLLRRSDNDDTTTIWMLHEALKHYPNDDDDTMMMRLYCDDGDDLFDASAASRQWLCALHMTTMIWWRYGYGDDWLLHKRQQWISMLHILTTTIRWRGDYYDDTTTIQCDCCIGDDYVMRRRFHCCIIGDNGTTTIRYHCCLSSDDDSLLFVQWIVNNSTGDCCIK